MRPLVPSPQAAKLRSLAIATLLVVGGTTATAAATDHLPTPSEPTARGMTLAGTFQRSPDADPRYAVLEVGDPVHDPGTASYGNRTAQATLRVGPVASTGGLAPPFIADTFWVDWTKDPAGTQATEDAWRAGLWRASLTGSASQGPLDLSGPWTAEPHTRSCQDGTPDRCQHEAAGSLALVGTVEEGILRLTGEARDAFCTEPGAGGPGPVSEAPQGRRLVPCGQ